MTTTLTFLGHSAFQLQTGEFSVLVDPFLSGNPQAAVAPDAVAATHILITHAHGDHIGDTVAIAKRTGARVIANHEISEWLSREGVENVHGQHIGGAWQHEFGTVKLTIAHHGSSFPDGSGGGAPCGFLVSVADGTIYFAGDTGLFLDMQLIGEAGIDVACLPIGDNYTMGPSDAVRAIEFLRPRRVVPIHYNTFPVIEQNPDDFASEVRTRTSAEPVVLKPGESLDL